MAQINSTTVTGVITQTDPATAPNHLVRLSEAQALGAVGSVNGQTGVVVLNTSHLAENTNLFYTDARVRACVLTGFSATTGAITAADTVLTALNKTQGRLAALEAGSVTSVNGQSGVVVLNTSHLTESGNLFYTDTRVRSCVLTGFSAATGAITASDTVLTAFNKTQGRLAVIEAWTTTNLSEGSNLYYTDARVRACVLTGFSATTGAITAADTVLTGFNKTQGRLAALEAAAVLSVNGQIGAVVLNTSHVAENTNLYHTDARVRGCVLTGFSSTTGAITASDTVLTAFNKTQGRLAVIEAWTTTSLAEGSNLYYTDARVRGCVLTGFSATTGAITAADTVLTAFNKTQGRLAVIEAWTTTNLSEGSNLYYTDARVRACVLTGFSATTGAITASDTVLTAFNKTQGRLAVIEAWTTTSLAEGSNLYYTDARVRGCVLTGFSATTGAITAADTVLTAFNKTQGRLAVIEAWTTTNLSEGSNLYYTDARVRACVLTGFSATTGAITASDTVLTGFNKTQGRLAVLEAAISGSVLTGTGVLITDRVTTSLLEIADATSSASISMSGVDKISVFAGTFTMDVDLVTMFSGTLGADWFQSGSAVGTSFIQPSLTSGSPTILTVTGGAHTSLASTAEATDIRFNLNRVVQFATGALSTQRAVRIDAPQYAFVAASTLTNASTVEISGAPSAWTNATVTTAAGLRIKNGGLAAGNTNGYGLYCEAPTGATNNFAALFAGSVVIGGTPSMGGGVGVVFLANASTNPSSNPTGGGLLYVDAGALKYRGSGGTVTTVGVA